mgnify:CR=1 FL=1
MDNDVMLNIYIYMNVCLERERENTNELSNFELK